MTMTNNIDFEETQHFADMAEEWWNPRGPCRPLHDLNPVRLQFITDRVEVIGKKILDIGCGGGLLTESLAKRHAIVTGIDASAELIEVAKKHAAAQAQVPGSGQTPSHTKTTQFSKAPFSNALSYFHTSAEAFAKDHAAEFDVITCLELLEHVPDPASLILACRKLIKPGGTLFFSTLNRNPKSYFMAILGAEHLLKILPKNTHHYAKFIKPSELDQALRQADLKLKDMAGLNYNPFTHQAKLTQDVSVNYIVQAVAE